MRKKKPKKNYLPGQQNFYFEDFEYTKYNFKSKINALEISFNRIAFIFFIFLVIGFIYGIKIIYLGSINNSDYIAGNLTSKSVNFRKDILDRNGNILATSITVYDVAIRPNLIRDEKKLLINLKLIFPFINIESVKKKISVTVRLNIQFAFSTLSLLEIRKRFL